MHMQTIAHTPQIIKLRLLTRFVDNIKCRFPGNRNGNKNSVLINPAISEIFKNIILVLKIAICDTKRFSYIIDILGCKQKNIIIMKLLVTPNITSPQVQSIYIYDVIQ